MPGNLPDRIDRPAIERVIQRAAELQTGERDIGDGLTPDEVIALGQEVGIPERYLKQALLEEHARPGLPEAGGPVERLFGMGTVTAQRVVQGEPAQVTSRLLTWMDREELLTLQRQQPGRISWEPVGGVAAAVRRSSAALSGKKAFMLTRAELVTAVITSLEPGYTHVILSADLTSARRSVAGGAVGLVGLGVVASGVLAVMSPFLWVALAPLPLFAGLGLAVSRQHRPVAARALLGLERALDHVERGEVKASHALPARSGGLMGLVLDEVRRALNQ